jgi:hypothetical protein
MNPGLETDMRRAMVFFAAVALLGLVPAQQPEPAPPVPLPPRPASPRAAPVPPTPPYPEAPQPPAPRAAQEQDDRAEEAARALAAATDIENLVAEAAEVTGLDRDTVRPAVAAMWPKAVATTVDKKNRAVWRAYAAAPLTAETERRMAEAVSKLPYEKQEVFVRWVATKRRQIAELSAATAESATRNSLRSFLLGQSALENTRRDLLAVEALRGQRGAGQEEWEALSLAQRALADQQQSLAREMEALARVRIEGALDKDLWTRYRDLAGTVDAERSRKLIEDLTRSRLLTARGAETQPAEGLENLERRLVELRDERLRLDQAIEKATTELVRERAARLHQEAIRREQEQKASRNTAPEGEADAEVRELREELRRLRAEVESLRKKEKDKEPK